MYVDSSACVIVKGGEGERFRIDSGVYNVPLAVQCIYGGENREGKEGSELPGEWERVEIA